MKRILNIFLLLMLLTISVSAQHRKFDPEQFTRDQETFITKKAQLTTNEANAFFPVFREYQQKLRGIFKQQRKFAKTKPQNDKEALKLISEHEKLENQIVKLHATYHAKFCKVLAPTKVYRCLQAEEQFKHKMMRNVAERRHGNKK